MRRTFSFSSCSFGGVVFLPPVVFLQCFPGHVRYFLFLCGLLVIVSLVFSCFIYFFSVLSGVCCVTVLRPPSFLWVLSSPPWVPPLFFCLCFVFLYCLCFSPVLVISTPAFASAVLGLGSVLGVATAPVVPSVAPPFFRPFVSAPRFQLAAVPDAPSSLCLRFSACCGYGCFVFIPISACCGFYCSFRFGAAPAILLDEGSLDVVPRGPVATLPCVYARFLSYGLSQVAFVYHRFVFSGCGLSLCVSSSCFV